MENKLSPPSLQETQTREFALNHYGTRHHGVTQCSNANSENQNKKGRRTTCTCIGVTLYTHMLHQMERGKLI